MTKPEHKDPIRQKRARTVTKPPTAATPKFLKLLEELILTKYLSQTIAGKTVPWILETSDLGGINPALC